MDIVGTWRYVGEIDEFAQNRFTADAQNYLDLAVGYNLEILGGNTQITVGITNIFDEDPPVHGLFNTAPFSNGNTIPGIWDPLGRYWFVGFSYGMGDG